MAVAVGLKPRLRSPRKCGKISTIASPNEQVAEEENILLEDISTDTQQRHSALDHVDKDKTVEKRVIAKLDAIEQLLLLNIVQLLKQLRLCGEDESQCDDQCVEVRKMKKKTAEAEQDWKDWQPALWTAYVLLHFQYVL